MTIIGRYLAYLWLTRFIFVLAGITAIALLMDFFSNVDEILESENDMRSAFRYALLRLPIIVDKMIPFSVLLGTLLTLSRLIRHNELTILSSVGVSRAQIAFKLVPVVLLVVTANFFIKNEFVPMTSQILHEWGVADYGDAGSQSKSAIWIRQANNVLRFNSMERNGRRLSKPTLFIRDQKGNLIRRIDADEATYKEKDIWIFRNAEVSSIANKGRTKTPVLSWKLPLTPEMVTKASRTEADLPLGQLWEQSKNEVSVNRPRYFYQAALNQRIAEPLISLLLLLLVVPLSYQISRSQGTAMMFVAGVSLGFLYYVFDALVLTMGQAGLLPPLFAVWLPKLLLAIIAIILYLQHELLKIRNSVVIKKVRT